jgi:hypothetical protein
LTFKGKSVKVIITGDAKEEYEELIRAVDEEISEGITSSDNQTLLNSIRQKMELLKENPEVGVHIPKDRIPKEYIQKYGVNNLWKINLSSAWRMIYTIRGSEVEIISLIMDIIDHRHYNKKFRYK